MAQSVYEPVNKCIFITIIPKLSFEYTYID